MKKICKILTWYYILIKRLLKKPGFLIILLLIPLFSVFLNLAAEEEKSIVKVAIASYDKSDYAQEIIDKVSENNKLVSYHFCQEPNQAIEMVKKQEVDTAWIIKEDAEKLINDFALGKNTAISEIYVVEDNTFIQSSREILFEVLFERIAYRMYTNSVNAAVGEGIAEEDVLQEKYYIFDEEDAIVEMKFLNSANNILENADYLTAPLRGLLAILMMFCGMASMMFFNNDDRKKVFSGISYNKRAFVMFGNNLAATSVAGVIVTISLIASGIYTNFVYESVMMILMVLAVTGFCSLIGSVFSSNTLLSAMLPSLLIISLAFSPVFINLHSFEPVQGILPPYYYLYGINNLSYAFPYMVYILAYFVLAYFIYTKKCARKD